jgi:seryl-tRNA synthetase
MHDLKWIRENPADFDKGLARRGLPAISSEILAKDEERRANTTALQEIQARRNSASKEIGRAKGKGGDPARADALMAEVASLKDKIAAGEQREREIEEELRNLLAGIPNIPAPDVPDGKDEHDNVEIRREGQPRAFNFEPKQHFELGEALGLMDFEAAAKMSGARFTVLKGALARLDRALGQFMLDVQTQDHGYTEVNPPILVRDHAMFGTAQLPKFREDQFRAVSEQELKASLSLRPAGIENWTPKTHWNSALMGDMPEEPLKQVEKFWKYVGLELLPNFHKANDELASHWLIPTAEVPLTNLVRESILSEAELPYRFTALTPCFRAEAGAAGKDTRGMIRQHQFYKVELVSITTPEQSQEEHERMTACAETILKRLELPYRTVVLCTGDMGFASKKTYDIEVWLPGQNAYREISSCSNCGDFQARRMQARFRSKESRDLQFVHTLNGSGLAVGRTLIAVMENYQEKDGSIRVPEALLPYMGGIAAIGAA